VHEDLPKGASFGGLMSSIQFLAPTGAHARECTYNLFRNRPRPELLCAVPEDRPVPGFVDPDEWRFERTLRPLEMSPPGFENRAAQAGVRFNGYYLFQLTDSRRELAA
jgi:hypothetical protein